MELAKNLAQWRDRSPEQWMALANRYLPAAAVAVLVILIAYRAAGLTWQLLESPAGQDFVPAVLPVAAAAGDIATSYDALSGWRPFGDPPEEGIPGELAVDAQETDLPLILRGAVHVQAPPERGETFVPEPDGMALIAAGRGDQTTYRTGEEIEDARGASLLAVLPDHVLIDRGGGRVERLSFPEPDRNARAGTQLNSRIPATRPPPAAQEPSAQAAFIDSVSNVATTLGQHMSLAQASENGEQIGWRLQPRGDSEVFSQLGLEPGDVLTEVNGIRLDDLRNISQVMQALGENPQASVMIRRDGVDQSMVIDLGQLERLAESLQ